VKLRLVGGIGAIIDLQKTSDAAFQANVTKRTLSLDNALLKKSKVKET
jgi:hypothetical protein